MGHFLPADGIGKPCHWFYSGVMTTMNVSLPDELKDFVDERVDRSGYGSTSEYVRDLIRRDRERQQLRELIVEGLGSEQVGPADEAFFAGLRSKISGS